MRSGFWPQLTGGDGALTQEARGGDSFRAITPEPAQHLTGCACPGCSSAKEQMAAKAEGAAGSGSQPASAATQSAGDGPPQYLGPGDTIPDNTSSTVTIAVGSSLSSSINAANDLDYIKVSLIAGQTYTFSLDGVSIVDPYIELRNAGDTIVDQDDDGGILYDSFLMYRPTVSGDYWIVARGYDAGQTGTYTLSVNAIQTGNSSPTTFIDNGKPTFSWDEAAIQISREGASWASNFNTAAVVTYAYRSTAPGAMPDDTGGFSRFSAAQIAAADASLAAWASVANIVFQRVDNGDGYSNNATMLFANYSSGAAGAAAFAYLPSSANTSSSSVQGDVWVNISLANNQDLTIGAYGRQVLMHEIGHAIGLSHPGDYNAGPNVTIEYNTHAEYFNDSRVFTVMSYFGSSFVGGSLPAFASLPQTHDIAAVQRLYGANLATRTGNTIYGYNSNTGVPEYALTLANQSAVFTIWDGGGMDTLDLSGYTTSSTIDLRQEGFSSVGGSIFNISISRGAVIENAVGGSGGDTIIGNDAANALTGNGENDSLFGREGNDQLFAGPGADALAGGVGNDFLDGGAGGDTAIFSSTRASSLILSYGPMIAVLNSGPEGRDRLTGIEQLDFSDGIVGANTAQAFAAYDYLATYADLLSAFGDNPQGAFDHYIDWGFMEGRPRDNFPNYDYLASYSDLLIVFGDNPETAAIHYVKWGFAEGRTKDTFSNYDYLASYSDLLLTFGNNPEAAAIHYVKWGFAEGRAKDTFSNYDYLASHPDLIVAFGADAEAAAKHYVQWGFSEGRALDTFDAAQYLANYADLQAAYGDDLLAATIHFIQWGYFEGRTDDPLVFG